MQKIFNKGNQFHCLSSCGSGSDFLTSYVSSSGTASQKDTVPTVPALQPCLAD
jgi:hypothetical protein